MKCTCEWQQVGSSFFVFDTHRSQNLTRVLAEKKPVDVSPQHTSLAKALQNFNMINRQKIHCKNTCFWTSDRVTCVESLHTKEELHERK